MATAGCIIVVCLATVTGLQRSLRFVWDRVDRFAMPLLERLCPQEMAPLPDDTTWEKGMP